MDRVVLITGASSGLGKELAKLYLEKGYKLILSGQREEGFEDFKNDSIDIVVGDLTKPEIIDTHVPSLALSGVVLHHNSSFACPESCFC